MLGGRHSSFGKGIYAERNLWLEAVASYRSQGFRPRVTIGDHVRFSDGVHISSIEIVSIGSHCLFGSYIHVSDYSHGIDRGEKIQSRLARTTPPISRRTEAAGQWSSAKMSRVGDNSVILGPATIGTGSIVVAHSGIVRGAILPFTIVARRASQAYQGLQCHNQYLGQSTLLSARKLLSECISADNPAHHLIPFLQSILFAQYFRHFEIINICEDTSP